MTAERPTTSRLLRRRHQSLIAGTAAVALALIVLSYATGRGTFRRWTDIDAPRLPPPVFQVDLNTADWPELTQLPGVGETLARRIVEWRKAHGPFRSLDDLRRVHGVGKTTLERLAPYVTPLASAPQPSASQTP